MSLFIFCLLSTDPNFVGIPDLSLMPSPCKWLTLERRTFLEKLAATQLVKMSSAVTHKSIQLKNVYYGLDESILAHTKS
jgi:hypothetical protein